MITSGVNFDGIKEARTYLPTSVEYNQDFILDAIDQRISEFIIDENLLKVGSELIWLWMAIEPETRQILALSISKERNMFVAERFLDGLVKVHGNRLVSTDTGIWYP